MAKHVYLMGRPEIEHKLNSTKQHQEAKHYFASGCIRLQHTASRYKHFENQFQHLPGDGIHTVYYLCFAYLSQ